MTTINFSMKTIMLVVGVILLGCEYKDLQTTDIIKTSTPPVGEILEDTTCVTSQVAKLDPQPFVNAFLQNIEWKYGAKTEKGDTVVFALINNKEDYEKYVGFKEGQVRPTIDFSKYNLLGHALLALNCIAYKNSTLQYGCNGYVYTITYWRGICDQVEISSNLLIVQKPDLPVRLLIKYEN